MIRRLHETLRIAGLEDMLTFELGLRPGRSHWLARLGRDEARQRGIELTRLSGEPLLAEFLRQLRWSGYGDLLDAVAADAPLFAARLAASPDGDDGLPRAA